MALLIVNADDYGLTEGVSRAILAGHRHGVITSTSVLALAPAYERTVRWLADEPGLGIGAHLAAVGEDPPLLSAREIPSLVDRSGRLHLSWRTFLPAAALGGVDPEDLRREFDAQLECLTGAGLVLDHLDTHQNLHLWPLVRDVVMELGDRHGIRAIRVTRSASRGVVAAAVRRLAAELEHRCDDAGWRYPQASSGLDEAGRLDAVAMASTLGRLAATGATSVELATHPGEADDPALVRYRWGYRWADEAAAVRSDRVRALVERLGFTLGTFGALDGSA